MYLHINTPEHKSWGLLTLFKKFDKKIVEKFSRRLSQKILLFLVAFLQMKTISGIIFSIEVYLDILSFMLSTVATHVSQSLERSKRNFLFFIKTSWTRVGRLIVKSYIDFILSSTFLALFLTEKLKLLVKKNYMIIYLQLVCDFKIFNVGFKYGSLRPYQRGDS